MMSEKKEENGNQMICQSYINQNAISETIVETIHKSSSKGVLSCAASNKSAERAKRRVIMSKGKKDDLPILGMSYLKEESKRIYESLIVDKKIEPAIRKIKMSQLSQMTNTKKAAISTPIKTKPEQLRQTFGRSIYPHSNKNHGYEHQKTRLERNQRKMRQLYTSYERYNKAEKLSDFKQNLRDEAIQSLRQSLRSGLSNQKFMLLI